MDLSDKFCLKWNDFRDNASTSFKELQSNSDFADVTLVGEGKEPTLQIEAHKIILASSSPLFRDMLKQSKHPHPIIYMRGIETADLAAIVEFIYQGEVSVCQENLETFMVIAQELRVKGLGAIENPSDGKETCKTQNTGKKRKLDLPVELIEVADKEYKGNVPSDQTAETDFMGKINHINEEKGPYNLQKTKQKFSKQPVIDLSVVDFREVTKIVTSGEFNLLKSRTLSLKTLRKLAKRIKIPNHGKHSKVMIENIILFVFYLKCKYPVIYLSKRCINQVDK